MPSSTQPTPLADPTPRIARAVRRRTVAAVLAGSLGLLSAALVAVSAAPTAVALPATLPLTISGTGSVGAPRLYVIGTDLTTGRQGYVTAAGQFVPWNLPTSDGVVDAPDISIAGPASGSQQTVSVPRNVSGRLYFSYGAPLWLGLTRGGLVQPAPWNATDRNAGTLMDWAEFTYDGGGLWLNSSQVDQLGVPHEVSVTSAGGTTTRTGGMTAAQYTAAIQSIVSTAGFERTAVRAADGSLLRVLSPGKATAVARMDPAYLNPAIDAAWSGADGAITVAPFGADPARTYVGRGTGSSMTFTDSTGRQVASFAKPTSLDAWECAGALVTPNDQIVGPIARTLCAALHRGTLGSGATEPVTDAARFYRATYSDHYSGAIHANTTDHLAYAFAFDDVAHQESLVHDANPIGGGIVLQPGGATGTTAPAPTTTAPTTATPTATATSSPTTSSGTTTTRTVAVTFPSNPQGWATLTFGTGTKAGLVTVKVDGGTTSTVSVDGPGQVRTDLSGPPKQVTVTISSTTPLGAVTITLP